MTTLKSTPTEKETASRALSLAQANKKRIIGAAVALVVLIGGGFGYYYGVQQPKNEKAQEQLTAGLQLMEQAVQMSAQNVQIQAMPDSSLTTTLRQRGMLTSQQPDSVAMEVKKFRAEQQKMATDLYDKALKGDGKFPGFVKIAKAGAGDASNMAHYLAGVCLYHQGNYKEAIAQLEDFSAQRDHAVSPVALAALANCYACNDQIDKAIDAFKEAADQADNASLTPLYLIEAGKLLEHSGKKEEANAIYRSIKADYPQYGLTQQGMGSSEVDKLIERTK